MTSPTGARPGSREKIEVMRQRWAARQPLHHAHDAQIDQPDNTRMPGPRQPKHDVIDEAKKAKATSKLHFEAKA